MLVCTWDRCDADGMVWYGAGIRKLGDGEGMVTGGGT